MQVTLTRDHASIPWGFRLKGGAEFNVPLSILRINDDSPSHGRLVCGDTIIRIGHFPALSLNHDEALNIIRMFDTHLPLVVNRQQPTAQPPPQQLHPQSLYHQQPQYQQHQQQQQQQQHQQLQPARNVAYSGAHQAAQGGVWRPSIPVAPITFASDYPSTSGSPLSPSVSSGVNTASSFSLGSLSMQTSAQRPPHQVVTSGFPPPQTSQTVTPAFSHMSTASVYPKFDSYHTNQSSNNNNNQWSTSYNQPPPMHHQLHHQQQQQLQPQSPHAQYHQASDPFAQQYSGFDHFRTPQQQQQYGGGVSAPVVASPPTPATPARGPPTPPPLPASFGPATPYKAKLNAEAQQSQHQPKQQQQQQQQSDVPDVLFKAIYSGTPGSKKPFTYTPGGLDLSHVRDSPRVKRLPIHLKPHHSCTIKTTRKLQPNEMFNTICCFACSFCYSDTSR